MQSNLIDWHKNIEKLSENDIEDGVYKKIIWSLNCFNCGVLTPILEEKEGFNNRFNTGKLMYYFPVQIYKNCQFCNYLLVKDK